MKSTLHDQVKDLLRINLSSATDILAAHEPELLRSLESAQARILSLPSDDPNSLLLRRAYNAYLTYSRAVVWNDTLRNVAERNEEIMGHAS